MPDHDSVYVFATLIAAAGHEAQLREILTTLVNATRKEAGNLLYHVHEAAEAPGTFLVYEVYKDEVAVEAHMNSQHLKTALGEAGPLLGAPPVITKAKLVA